MVPAWESDTGRAESVVAAAASTSAIRTTQVLALLLIASPLSRVLDVAV